VGKAVKFSLVAAALLMLPWLTQIAYGNSSPGAGMVRIEAVEGAKAPRATFIGLAYGSVTPGDLFYFDASGSPGGIVAELYLTNARELVHHLRYLILKVSVYPESGDGEGRQAPEASTCLTMQNSPVQFILPGGSRYRVSVDSGSYYCQPAGAGSGHEAPQFYLAVTPE
jgi:hypothetical protein